MDDLLVFKRADQNISIFLKTQGATSQIACCFYANTRCRWNKSTLNFINSPIKFSTHSLRVNWSAGKDSSHCQGKSETRTYWEKSLQNYYTQCEFTQFLWESRFSIQRPVCLLPTGSRLATKPQYSFTAIPLWCFLPAFWSVSFVAILCI